MNPFRKNRGQRRSYRPFVEGLEDRTVPAGNVTAVISGGNLIISGDSGDNQIKITGSTRGPIDIEAIDTATVINNQPGMVTLLGFRGSIIVDLGDGNDTLIVDRVPFRGTLNVNMGAGDDDLTVSSSIINSFIDLQLGTGSDVLVLQGVRLERRTRIDAGDGDDQVVVNGSNLGRDSIFIGGGGVNSVGYVGSKFSGIPRVDGFQQVIATALPRAANDTATVTKGGTTVVNVTANDAANIGALKQNSVAIVNSPVNGTATVLDNGSISYTHNGTFTSSDSLRYTVQNERGTVSNIASVNFTITGFTGSTVTVATTAVSPTKTTPVPFTATFSDDVTGFELSDLTVTNGTASNLVAVNAKTYTFSVTPTADGAVSVIVPAGVAQNAVSLSNSASSPVSVTFDATAPVITINPLVTNDTTPTITGTVNDSSSTVKVTVNGQTLTAIITGTTRAANVTTALAEGTFALTATATDAAGNTATANNATGLVVDLTPPTVAVTSSATSPTNLTLIPITITFSEAVGSFIDESDITVTNGTASNFQAQLGGTVYTASISPNAAGPVTVSVAAGVANDQAGNLNSASPVFSIDFSTQPGVAITTTGTNPTNSTTIPITVTFTQDVTGFDVSEIAVTNGTLSNFAMVNAKTYTATVTATGAGTVTVDVPANAALNSNNNGNTAAPTLSVVVDQTPPTVVVTSTDPNPTASAFIPVTITFDEAVSGFDISEVAVTNGVAGGFTASPDGKVYSVNIAPGAPGVVTVSVATGVASDEAGNPNTASAVFSITAAVPGPTVAITSTVAGPTASPIIPINVTFAQDVTGFDASDIVVGNGTLSNFTVVDARTYTATVTATANGAVTVNVPANAAVNSTNAPNVTAPTLSVAFSNAAPTVAHQIDNISKAAGAANTTFLLAGTFDDADITNSTATMNILKGTTPETLHLEFFDRDAPLTVANFFSYQTSYAADGGVFFHRLHLQTGLNVIQGGGYTDNDVTNGTHIATNAPIRNEYSDNHPNTRGTISMARTSDPNSATSEFFFNLDDANSPTLNSTNNGGFAVFGKVTTAADLILLDDLATAQIVTVNGFTEFPFVGTGNTVNLTDTIRISSVDIVHRDAELSYTVQSSNPGVVTASLSGFQNNQLTLDYIAAGTSTITVTTTDQAGHTASTTFTVTVT